VPPARLDAAWPDAAQRSRALASLITDGLAEPHPDGGYTLPAHRPALPATQPAHQPALPATQPALTAPAQSAGQ
jgi:hypothetical protein